MTTIEYRSTPNERFMTTLTLYEYTGLAQSVKNRYGRLMINPGDVWCQLPSGFWVRVLKGVKKQLQYHLSESSYLDKKPDFMVEYDGILHRYPHMYFGRKVRDRTGTIFGIVPSRITITGQQLREEYTQYIVTPSKSYSDDYDEMIQGQKIKYRFIKSIFNDARDFHPFPHEKHEFFYHLFLLKKLQE